MTLLAVVLLNTANLGCGSGGGGGTTGSTNQAPTVNAGSAQTINLGDTATLSGTATDDGKPTSNLGVQWTKVSGPGTVTFADPNKAATTATFSAAGEYTLQLSATDGDKTTNKTVVVTVNEVVVTNAAPTADAGPNRDIDLGQTATLSGTVTDDGKPAPPAAVTATWTKKSGPGTVTFANANAAATTATFSVEGTYVLTLTANDGEKTDTDDMTVTVTKPPVTGPAVSTFSPSAYTVGQPVTVTLAIKPESGVSVYAVEDAVPTGWTVSDISDSGAFDAVNNKVKWGPFFDNTARNLTYKVTPPTGTTGQQSFAGTASFDGTDTAVNGDRNISPAP